MAFSSLTRAGGGCILSSRYTLCLSTGDSLTVFPVVSSTEVNGSSLFGFFAEDRRTLIDCPVSSLRKVYSMNGSPGISNGFFLRVRPLSHSGKGLSDPIAIFYLYDLADINLGVFCDPIPTRLLLHDFHPCLLQSNQSNNRQEGFSRRACRRKYQLKPLYVL